MTKNKRGIWIFGAAVLLFILALYFDSHIIQGVSYLKNSFLDEFLIGLTFTGTEIIIFFLLTSLFLWSENKRKWILPLWFTLLLSTIVSFLLKITIQRLRPFQQGLIDISSFLVKDSYYVWDFSFPSAQTMAVFCAVPFLSKEFPTLQYVWIALACLVGFSRIYFASAVATGSTPGPVAAGPAKGPEARPLAENRFWED